MSTHTSFCSIFDKTLSCSNSIGSSNVIICLYIVLLISHSIEVNEKDFHEPVGHTISINPKGKLNTSLYADLPFLSISHKSSILGGIPDSITLITADNFLPLL